MIKVAQGLLAIESRQGAAVQPGEAHHLIVSRLPQPVLVPAQLALGKAHIRAHLCLFQAPHSPDEAHALTQSLVPFLHTLCFRGKPTKQEGEVKYPVKGIFQGVYQLCQRSGKKSAETLCKDEIKLKIVSKKRMLPSCFCSLPFAYLHNTNPRPCALLATWFFYLCSSLCFAAIRAARNGTCPQKDAVFVTTMTKLVIARAGIGTAGPMF